MAEEAAALADDSTLGVMTAVFNDKIYAKRFKEILEVRAQNEALKADALAAREEAAKLLKEARALYEESEAAKASAAALVADFNQRNEDLGKALNSHNDAVNAFGAMRAEVEQGHRDKKAEQDQREAQLAKWSKDLKAAEKAVGDREAEAAVKEAELAERESALAEIVAKLSPKKRKS